MLSKLISIFSKVSKAHSSDIPVFIEDKAGLRALQPDRIKLYNHEGKVAVIINTDPVTTRKERT